jgi:nicotinate-nucleotide pyrophosphorylase (carboxylating)
VNVDRFDVHPPLREVIEAVSRALDEDILALGDLTAQLLEPGKTATFYVVSRSDGVVAGERCVEEVFRQIDTDIRVDWVVPDGERISPGEVVAVVDGVHSNILSAERTALNFLGHLSGVATLTREFVDAVEEVGSSTKILDTRKTTPGLRALEKAAVRAGGGRNHRMSLSDAVLIKDNHLKEMSIEDGVTKARDMWPGRMIEVECDRFSQVKEAAAAGASTVLLDNMTPEEAQRCVGYLRERGEGPNRVLAEISGGVSLTNIRAYALTGADFISIGSLTHSAPSLDVGLDVSESLDPGRDV